MARNAKFQLTPNAVTLIATGKVAPAIDWSVQVPQGADRPQRRDEHGMPLWIIDALDETDPDANRSSVVSIEVSSMIEPEVPRLQRLELAAVAVSLYVNKAGQLNISYAGNLKSNVQVKAA